jgi:hypothetical protein
MGGRGGYTWPKERRGWGVYCTVLLLAVAGVFAWFLVQGILTGGIYMLWRRRPATLYTLHDNPGMFWVVAAVYAFLVVTNVRLLVWVLKHMAGEKREGDA